jgi:site-specific DNA recombinase
MSTPPVTRYAAIYARVSTEDQGRGYSIPTQIEACQKLAAHEGYMVPERYVFTDELSGSILERPGLLQLRELIRSRAIQAVMIYDLDRLSRKHGHQLLLLEECERAEGALLVASGPIDTSPEGALLLYVKGAMGEYERAKILERTCRGRLGRAKAGHPQGGGVLFGYHYLSEPHKGFYVIDEAEAAIVRRVFALCLRG